MLLHVSEILNKRGHRKGRRWEGGGKRGSEKEKIKEKGRQRYPFHHSYGESIYTSHTWNTLAS